MRNARWLLLAFAACGAPGGAAVDATPYADARPLNPRLDDGRLLFLEYGDHHPTCFAFTGPEGGPTEEVGCASTAHAVLESCPAGKLFKHASEAGCVCLPLGDEPAQAVSCPH
jgi:hypothetical protein